MDLTVEEAHRLLSYNEVTGKLTWRVSLSNRVKIGDEAGWVRNGYRAVAIYGITYPSHWVVWFLVHGHWPSCQIDHVNGIVDDNRVSKLREVDHTGNGRNRRVSKRNKSGVNGVDWRSNRKKWRAQIWDGERHISLGHFDNLDDAAAVRKSAEVEYGFHPNHGRA